MQAVLKSPSRARQIPFVVCCANQRMRAAASTPSISLFCFRQGLSRMTSDSVDRRFLEQASLWREHARWICLSILWAMPERCEMGLRRRVQAAWRLSVEFIRACSMVRPLGGFSSVATPLAGFLFSAGGVIPRLFRFVVALIHRDHGLRKRTLRRRKDERRAPLS